MRTRRFLAAAVLAALPLHVAGTLDVTSVAPRSMPSKARTIAL